MGICLQYMGHSTHFRMQVDNKDLTVNGKDFIAHSYFKRLYSRHQNVDTINGMHMTLNLYPCTLATTYQSAHIHEITTVIIIIPTE